MEEEEGMIHEFKQHREAVAFKLLKLPIEEIPLSVDIQVGLEGNQASCYIEGARPRMGAVQKGTKRGWGPQMTLDRGALKVFVESKR